MMEIINVEKFYNYWADKVKDGLYSNIYLSYDKYSNEITVYLLREHIYNYVGRINCFGQFSGDNFVYEQKDENPVIYDKWIKDILAIAISDACNEIMNLKDILKVYKTIDKTDGEFLYNNLCEEIIKTFEE